MASIQKRPDGVWRARYRDEAGKEHASHFNRKVDAQRWLDEVTADVLTGRYVDPKAGRITFSSWVKDWSTRQVWTAGTATAAAQATSAVTFSSVPISKITSVHVQRWIKDMIDKGLAPTTIRMRFSYVHMALRAAVTEKKIAEDPAANIRLPRTPRRDQAMIIPTSDQVRAVIEAAPEHFELFIALCAFAGLRLGEVAGLQVGDVDFLGRTLKIARQVQGNTLNNVEVCEPKSGSARAVPIADELVTMISAHMTRVGVLEHDGAQWLFTPDGEHLMNRAAAGRMWAKSMKEAGVSGFTLHSLRHFHASALIAAGCDVVTVQRALGHASASITLDVYSHLWQTGEDRTRAAARGLMRQTLTPADSPRTVSRETGAD